VAVLTTTAAVAVVLLGAGMPVAAAHDQVLATSPAQGVVIATSPQRVELELSSPAQALGTRVLVSGADGGAVSRGPVELRDTTVAQPLAADLPSGGYTIEWQVTSADGHPVSGTSTFTIAEGASAAPGAGPTAAAQGSTDPVGAPVGLDAEPWSLLAWIAVGAVVLVLATVLAVRQVPRRR
jgi:copper resistance protein C